MKEGNAANEKAIRAAAGKEELDHFLKEEKDHILRLTGKILNKTVTVSDEEYSVALLAVSEAVKNYDRTRGDFWSYAAFVIKSRETDLYRKRTVTESREFSVMPELFYGAGGIDDSERSLQHDISEKTAVSTDTTLKYEIEALGDELTEFGIDFFDLVGCPPRAKKSKEACGLALKALFTPPPLIEEIRRSKTLPIKKIIEREKISRKLIDRHRKYLISAAVILDGDYPGISEYLPYRRSME